jgi:hypothetical protein
MGRKRVSAQDKVLARLRAMGYSVPEGTTVERTYAGCVQRQEGAWSWRVVFPDLSFPMGSHYPMQELLAYPRWTVGQDADGNWNIDPDETHTSSEGPEGLPEGF